MESSTAECTDCTEKESCRAHCLQRVVLRIQSTRESAVKIATTQIIDASINYFNDILNNVP